DGAQRYRATPGGLHARPAEGPIPPGHSKADSRSYRADGRDTGRCGRVRCVAAQAFGRGGFIGHSRSPLWRGLKGFLNDRLRVPWDEFNRVPEPGVATSARLLEMLDDAAFAFLILTGEDETADGQFQSRMNVIHEAGLFQARLGLRRAIVMREDGCAEFSN